MKNGEQLLLVYKETVASMAVSANRKIYWWYFWYVFK